MLVSLLAHASLISATYFIWSPPVDRIAFTGQRNAIWIEATPTQPPQPTATISTVEPIEPDTLSPETMPELIESEPAEQPVEVARRPTWTDLAEAARPADSAELLLAPPPPDAPRPALNDDILMSQVPSQPPQVLPRTEVSQLIAPMLESQRQVAGIEEKLPPDFSANRPPTYPPEAVQQRLEGTVMLRLHIASTGVVERVEVAESSGHASLDRAALDAVRQWRGIPASRGGRPVATDELLPIRFRL